eukprot:scaffold50622_cov43-Prasinocladus_malaysianus.AAC.1
MTVKKLILDSSQLEGCGMGLASVAAACALEELIVLEHDFSPRDLDGLRRHALPILGRDDEWVSQQPGRLETPQHPHKPSRAAHAKHPQLAHATGGTERADVQLPCANEAHVECPGRIWIVGFAQRVERPSRAARAGSGQVV